MGKQNKINRPPIDNDLPLQENQTTTNNQRNFSTYGRLGLVAPMERASVAMDGDSRTARDGAKWPLEWELQALAEQFNKGIAIGPVQFI